MTGPQEPRSAAAGHPAPEELSELAFSPETASAGVRGHVQDCASCTAETTELRALADALSALPEPTLPVSVGIRLDAALARAWQEADAEAATAAAGSGTREAAPSTPSTARPRSRWRRLALPLGAVCLLVAGVVGIGELLVGADRSGAPTSGAAAPAAGPFGTPAGTLSGDSALTAWVRSVLPGATGGTASGQAIAPQIGHGTANHSLAGPMCPDVPARPGYTELVSSAREFEGRAATLVVYRNDQEPASRPLFAVVYAGSCPTVSSVVLDQGLVSR